MTDESEPRTIHIDMEDAFASVWMERCLLLVISSKWFRLC